MFGLSFANPLVLIGLTGAGIPIVIHLLHRQRAAVHRFAAIDLLLRTQKRLAARLKLYQLLLLLLRVLIVACLAAALARPFLATGALMSGDVVPTSTVFVIDDSLSMRYKDGARTIFEVAVAAVRSLVTEMGEQDNGAVLVASAGRDTEQAELSFDRRELLRRLGNLEVGFGSRSPAEALLAACDLLATSRLKRKRIVLCHDATAAAWRDEDLPTLRKRLAAVDASLMAISLRPADRLPNGAVLSVAVERGKANSRNVKLTTDVSAPRDKTPCQVFVADQRMAQGFIGASSKVRKEFSLTNVPSKGTTGRVVLPGDSLAEDDVRYFTLESSQHIQALVIDGEPSTSAHQSETFYLERALAPSQDVDSSARVRVAAPDVLRETDLAAFDVVMLCNMGEWPGVLITALKRYVTEGGNVIVTLGERVDRDRLNAELGGLLPCLLRDPKTFDEEPARLDVEGIVHPVAKAVVTRKSDAGAVEFTRTVATDGRLAPDSEVILRYSDGLPALVLRRHGRGSLTLLTSTIDREWANLAIRTVFVPLMHELLAYLAGRSSEGPVGETLVGEPRKLRLPRHVSNAMVVGPDGRAEQLKLKDGQYYKTAVATRTPLPGAYTARTAKQQQGRRAPDALATFVVNVDPRESDLTRLEPRFFEKHLGRDRVVTLDAHPGGYGGPTVAMRKRELSFGLLSAVLALLLVEALVAIRE